MKSWPWPRSNMLDDDRIRVQHMLDASQDALSFVEGHEEKELNEDRMLLLALVKCIEIIGEAASRVSDELRDANPQIPWRQIIATRNRLIHGYFNINPRIVWNTVKQ